MNWGKWIFIVIALFMFGTLFMVYIAMNQEYPLVTKDYYKQELQYDKKLEKMNNHIRNDSLISLSQINNFVRISSKENQVEVELFLYRPSDDKLDKHFSFTLSNNSKELNLTSIQKGLYIAKMTYKILDKEYYFEKDIMVK